MSSARLVEHLEGFIVSYLLLPGMGPTAVLPEPIDFIWFGGTNSQLQCKTFRLPCMESGVGLDAPHESLPTKRFYAI